MPVKLTMAIDVTGQQIRRQIAATAIRHEIEFGTDLVLDRKCGHVTATTDTAIADIQLALMALA